ncbi:DUF1764-domain-containing protein, partial [Martensiomyces pterosporus]
MAKDTVVGGKVTKNKAAPAAKKPATKAASEIDDIFSAKPSKNEIDDIFTTKPAPAKQAATKKQEKEQQAKPTKSIKVIDATAADRITKQQRQPPPPKDDDFADSRGKNSKYTDDGLRVFYMEDLHIGEGEGDTDQCPFDCDCCF